MYSERLFVILDKIRRENSTVCFYFVYSFFKIFPADLVY